MNAHILGQSCGVASLISMAASMGHPEQGPQPGFEPSRRLSIIERSTDAIAWRQTEKAEAASISSRSPTGTVLPQWGRPTTSAI
ncbi:hypothetical protein GCM10009560_44830 [Nonomuraea longicatena]|uniref:Uncharacterized protein n=1 Tax=Nonomuraea longicatena TaxID=83682 RepID=A0ABN1Q1K2_9ACTN